MYMCSNPVANIPTWVVFIEFEYNHHDDCGTIYIAETFKWSISELGHSSSHKSERGFMFIVLLGHLLVLILDNDKSHWAPNLICPPHRSDKCQLPNRIKN